MPSAHRERTAYLCRGAGDENRTRVASLEDWGSTIELHPRAGQGRTAHQGSRSATVVHLRAREVQRTHRRAALRPGPAPHPAAGTAEAVHRCGADLYRGTFRVLGSDEWVVEWVVSGPRKDYHMVTCHYRVSAGGE